MIPISAQAAAWELKKDEDGIQIYHRDFADSPYVEFKGETVVAAPMASLVALLRDVEACPKWQHKCGKRITLSGDYTYQLTDLPWPMSDRYALLYTFFTFAPDGKKVSVRVRDIPLEKLPAPLRKKVPPLKDLVKMNDYDGSWVFTKLSATTTKVVYQMHFDPAGSIPSSIMNTGFVDKPFHTLTKMKTVVKDPKYK
ncbi:START domain-containing protein [Myxococcota bacterium]|nr:START domain-containing protein [Myxococcota bacterium]